MFTLFRLYHMMLNDILAWSLISVQIIHYYFHRFHWFIVVCILNVKIMSPYVPPWETWQNMFPQTQQKDIEPYAPWVSQTLGQCRPKCIAAYGNNAKNKRTLAWKNEVWTHNLYWSRFIGEKMQNGLSKYSILIYQSILTVPSATTAAVMVWEGNNTVSGLFKPPIERKGGFECKH